MTVQPIVLGITGASGAIYGIRLLEVLLTAGRTVCLSISPSGQTVLQTELDVKIDLDNFSPAKLLAKSRSGADALTKHDEKIRYYHFQDLMSPIASGSFLTGGMVICPCSGSTLGAISNSIGGNLIHRAAEVHLKERRKLILVLRETPLSMPQIDNMRRAVEAGAVMLPASPGFYHGPKSIDDLVDFVVGRICDQLAVEHNLTKRWGTTPTTENGK
jgi:4-hydroxy-3-polyprenylbenzoate decarboxylase